MASNVQALISFQGQSLGAQHLGHCLTSETLGQRLPNARKPE